MSKKSADEYLSTLPSAPNFVSFLKNTGEVELGEWVSYSQGEYTGVVIFKRPVHYNGKKIGVISARESKWIMYEGYIPSVPQPIFHDGRRHVLKYANPKLEPINLASKIPCKNRRDYRLDGWHMIPFP